MIFTSGWEFSVKWNMFKSWLIWPLYIIGLVWAIGNLGKSHYSQDTIIETEYWDGTRKREKSNDIMDVMFGHILLPLIGHFILEPLIVAAVIYYPLMGILALIGKLVPYILSILVLAVCVGSFLFTSHVGSKKGSLLIILLALLFTGGFGYGGYAIYNAHAPMEITEGNYSSVNEEEAAPSSDADEFDDEFDTAPTTTEQSNTAEDDEFD